MKPLYAFLAMLLLATSMHSQTTELWSTVNWGNWGVFEGLIYKADGNGNCSQVVFAHDSTATGFGNYGGLLLASNGLVYGTAPQGGQYGYGVLYVVSPATGVYTKLWDFDNGTTGSIPSGNLMQASNGKLYGFTFNGGTSNKGVLFEYDITLDTCIARVHFDGTAKGENPGGYLIEATNGKFYGVGSAGGLYNYGTLFEYDNSTSTFTKLYDFDVAVCGRFPLGIDQASNGRLYGITRQGLAGSQGWIFDFDITTGIVTPRLQFTSAIGSSPSGGLVEAPNGKLYGMCKSGGDTICGGGTVYEFDTTTNSITNVVNVCDPADTVFFNYYPQGTLFLASNGKLYGSTDWTFFEYDYVSDTLIGKLDFQLTFNATEPRGVRFIEVPRNNSSYVWPGDCNKDGVADHVDFLSVGLAYTDSGTSRTCASLEWIAQAADNWTDTLPGGLNAHHADANGDGLVSADDSLAIQVNFGLTHALRPSNSLSTTTDFHLVPDLLTVLPGDTIRYTLLLTSGIPVDSLYGIAFTLSFDSSLAEPITGALQYGVSALGTIGTNLISMEKDFYQAGLIHAAVTRTDHTNATALTGSLGTFTLVVPSGITAPNVALVVTPQNIIGVTAAGIPVGFNALSDTVHINAPSGIHTILAKDLVLFPNPSSDRLTVRMKNELIQYIELADASGRRMYASAPSTRETVIGTADLAEGIYTVSVTTSKGIIHQKVVVSHR